MWITVQDIIDAAKKNGYPWGQGTYITKDKNGNVVEACVFGQIALNLDVDPDVIINALEGIHITSSIIWGYNDDDAESYEDVVQYVDKYLSEFPKDKKMRVKKGIHSSNIKIIYK